MEDFFLGDQPTAPNFGEFKFQLRSWQSTITFHCFLTGGRYFGQIIAKIDILFFLARIRAPCVKPLAPIVLEVYDLLLTSAIK